MLPPQVQFTFQAGQYASPPIMLTGPSGPHLLPFGSSFDNTSENDHKTVGTVTVYEAAGKNVF
jgi:hypothetical protein